MIRYYLPKEDGFPRKDNYVSEVEFNNIMMFLSLQARAGIAVYNVSGMPPVKYPHIPAGPATGPHTGGTGHAYGTGTADSTGTGTGTADSDNYMLMYSTEDYIIGFRYKDFGGSMVYKIMDDSIPAWCSLYWDKYQNEYYWMESKESPMPRLSVRSWNS